MELARPSFSISDSGFLRYDLTSVYKGIHCEQKHTVSLKVDTHGGWMTEQEERLNALMERDRTERLGTVRQEILDTVHNEGDPYGLSEAFREMTPFDKALGHLFGKLMQATGNAQVD